MSSADADPVAKDGAAEQLQQQDGEVERQEQQQPSGDAAGAARASGKRAVAAPVVEADPPSAVPATEERLPHLWRTTEDLPPWVAAQAGRMPPARQPLDDELLAAAAHDTCTFRADQTAAYHDAHRRELEENSARRKAEAEEAKARAEEARQQRQAAAEARQRAAAVAIRGARAAEAEAKLERAAMRAEEASREEAQKRLRCEKARTRRVPIPQALRRPVGTARLTTKLRTPSPPPHYASPRHNASDHVLRPAPTTSAFVALARATLAAESRTPMAPPSGAVTSAAPAAPGAASSRHGGANTVGREHGDARFKLSTTNATGWSMLPRSPRGKTGVLGCLTTDGTTVAAETAATVEVVPTVESTKPTTPTMADDRQGHAKRLGGSSVAGPSHQLEMAPLSPMIPGLGPWDDPTQKTGGDVTGGTTDRRESAGTLARRVCSPRKVNIRPVVAARSPRERQQRFVIGQPANIRKSMAKRETVAAPTGPSHERSSALSPRSRERASVVSSIGKSQAQVQQKHCARSGGHRTAHKAGHGGVGVYASAIDTSPWLGDELDASLAVVGF